MRHGPLKKHTALGGEHLQSWPVKFCIMCIVSMPTCATWNKELTQITFWTLSRIWFHEIIVTQYRQFKLLASFFRNHIDAVELSTMLPVSQCRANGCSYMQWVNITANEAFLVHESWKVVNFFILSWQTCNWNAIPVDPTIFLAMPYLSTCKILMPPPPPVRYNSYYGIQKVNYPRGGSLKGH